MRGTDFVLVVDEVGSTMVTLLPSCDEDGYCITGEIKVETDVGYVIMNQAWQTTITSIGSQPPSNPLILDLDEKQMSDCIATKASHYGPKIMLYSGYQRNYTSSSISNVEIKV